MSRIQFASNQPVLLASRGKEREDDCACADALVFSDQNDSENDCACADALAVSGQDGAENDCACVTSTSSFFAQSGNLFQSVNVYTATLNGEFHLALGNHGPCVLNDTAWQTWHSFDIPRALSTPFERQLAAEGLLESPGAAPSDTRPQTLTAWLHVTNRCNLACPYCYVEQSPAAMSRETAFNAVDELILQAKEAGFKALKLKYAGGEASLEFARIVEIQAYAQACASQNGLELRATLLTNGTRITPAQADWLAAQSIKVMISLDGIGAAHDVLRKTRTGAGTFRAVEQVVDDIFIPRGIHPHISMTLTGQNASAAPEVARWSIERSLPLSFNFYRHTGNERPQSLELDHQAILAGMEAAYRVFEEMEPDYPFLNGLLDRFQVGAHDHTCGVGSTYRVIAQDGRSVPCHMLLAQSREPVLHNLPVEEKEICKDCAFAHFCAGGCPLETFQATGQWDLPSPHCAIYRQLIPQALRLEGLRLLKTNGYLH